jgi:hypothetical protein
MIWNSKECLDRICHAVFLQETDPDGNLVHLIWYTD